MAKVQGLDRLRKKLQRFPAIVEQEIRAAMEASANEMVALMKSLVSVKSGTLRDSIGWTWGEAPKGSMTIGRVRSRTGNLVITIYAGGGDAFYAWIVELGSAPHLNGGRFAGSQHPGTAVQPFFFVSFRALRRRARSRVTRSINRAAKRTAAGG